MYGMVVLIVIVIMDKDIWLYDVILLLMDVFEK